jgi:hypothetical protein
LVLLFISLSSEKDRKTKGRGSIRPRWIEPRPFFFPEQGPEPGAPLRLPFDSRIFITSRAHHALPH